jgi:hypothetical protein
LTLTPLTRSVEPPKFVTLRVNHVGRIFTRP